MGFFSLFSRKEPDFETALSRLHLQITQRERSLAYIKTRERRAIAVVTFYSLAIWAVAVAVWYAGVAENWGGWWAVLSSPIGTLGIRRLVSWWYTRKEENEETILIELKKQQRQKVEELKKKTGYYSTKDLLEKYDEKTVSQKQKEEEEAKKKSAQGRSRPQPNAPPSPQQLGIPPHILAQRGVNPQNPNHLQGAAQIPTNLPPPRRTWADKLADVLLGADENIDDPTNPRNKYALICEKCYKHNGLALKDAAEKIKYACPRCGWLNGPKGEEEEMRRNVRPNMDGEEAPIVGEIEDVNNEKKEE